MSSVKLPIDVIPGSRPLRFRWMQVVDAIVGYRTIPMEGTLPAGTERAVADLIALTKRLVDENASLRVRVDDLANQLASATAPTTNAEPTKPDAPRPVVSSRKGRG